MRFVFLILMLMGVPALAAQDSATLNGSVPSDRRLTFLYEIDFGSPAQAWALNVNLTTGASDGLVVRLIDVGALASSTQTNPDAINTFVVTGAGTANASLNGSYEGVRCFAVEIETAQGTTASDFSGSVTTSVATLALVAEDQFVLSAGGTKIAVGKFAFWGEDVPQNVTRASSIEIDFGPAQQTIFLRLEGIGTGLDRIEFIDTTGGNGTVLATFTNPTAGAVTTVPLTHTGKATLRVNVVATTFGGGPASWAVNAPCSVHLSLVGVPGKIKSSDCSTSEGTSGLVLLVLVLASAALASRLRRA